MGAKKSVLDSLLPKFPPGTPASLVLEVMGKPDSIVTRLPGVHAGVTGASAEAESAEGIPTMPGPAMMGSAGGASAQQAKEAYMIYQWRGWHDYVWFRYDTASEKITGAEWFYAYE
jgi:hypothetical protein